MCALFNLQFLITLPLNNAHVQRKQAGDERLLES